MSDPEIPLRELSHRLLAWFLKNKRELPWRGEHDPYRIWISEVMLQQTRSDTAASYYLRWLTRFPDIRSLSQADEQQVLKAWEGLGYYSRARNLRRAARIIVERHYGRFPETLEHIRELPGVGQYTAAAVLSIAFAQPLGAVDGNVQRVVSRLLADPRPAGSPSARRRARKLVEDSFAGFHPGWINQAWMELGALVCQPVPRCAECPLASLCSAYREGRAREFPARVPPRPLPVRRESLLLLARPPLPAELARQPQRSGLFHGRPELLGELLCGSRVPLLLVRRASGGLLGGLWELPTAPACNGELRRLLEPRGIAVVADTGREVRHRYSHFEVCFRCHLAVFHTEQALAPWVEQRWVLPAELASYPRPQAHIKAMRLFGLSDS